VRVFIETTIPSYLTAHPSKDILQLARQQVTREWWDNHRQAHALFTSQVVLDEAAKGDARQAEERLVILAHLTLIESLSRANELAQQILEAGILPRFAVQDAAIIALATVHRMDILLSWNCRHLANAAIQAPLRRLAAGQGFELPVICTPDELLEDIG